MKEQIPFGLGFMGCGSHSPNLVAAAAASSHLKPVACYDPDLVRAQSIGREFGMDACTSAAELVERDDVQGLIIASPNNAHRENVELGTAAGKHVFVDKPIANTIEDAVAIIDAARLAGVTLAIGHNGRRMPGHRGMKRLIEEGAIGTPLTVEANFSHSGGLNLTPEHWRYYRSECPALPLMQLGIHFADTMQYLLGDVVEVSSFMSRVAIPADSEDVTVSIFRFGGGLLGYLGSNYASPPVYYINAYGTEGNLYCENGGRLRYRSAKNSEPEQVAVAGPNAHQEELEEFAQCAKTGHTPEVDGHTALKALAVVQAAVTSHQQNRAVSIAEIIGSQ